ncbi:hypothetical protein ACVGV8_00065, partial [Enterobacter intestinihominis]
ISKELGWKPLETFESGIRKTVEWFLANREWIATHSYTHLRAHETT